MGNICRSPAAESVFLKLSKDQGLDHLFRVDSAGTGAWHVGNRADPRSSEEGQNRGYSLESHARQVNDSDWERFDFLICMDEDNRQSLLRAGAPSDRVHLLLDWHTDTEYKEVPDPYYGGQRGFLVMYDLIEAACAELLDDLSNQGLIAP